MSYIKPGHYNLTELTITTHESKKISILEVLDSITIFEDIYSNYLHGNLVFEDSNDLHQLAPLIGEEIITMIYKTDDVSSPEIVRVFQSFRVETSNDKYKDRLSHVLHFVSKEAFEDSNDIISKSYKNKSVAFMVSDAFKFLNSNKKLNVGEFSGNYHIISPSWSPLQLINYCTSIASPKHYNGSMVLFYENSDGFNFKHLEELLSQDVIGLWAVSDNKNKTDNPSEQIYPSNNILKYTILKNSVDTLKSMHEGLYNNAVISYDNISKSYKVSGYEYDKEFTKSNHLAGFKLASDNFKYTNNNQKVTYISTTSHRYDSPYVKSKLGNINLSDRKEEIIPSRTSLLSQISAKQMELTVAGDNRLVAGKTIQVKIPNVTALENIRNNTHRYNYKKVLITSILNTFTQKTHMMTLRVADDSYTEDMKALPEFERVSNHV